MENGPKRIFIVDDHQMVIDGINLMLDGRPEFIVAGECTHPTEAIEMLRTAAVDILITDVGMPGMSGVELSRIVKSRFPEIKILALSMFGESQVIAEMIDAGISGYILKNSGKKELIEALTKIAEGQNYFGQEITLQLMKSFKRNQEELKLTDREIEIIRMIEKDMTTKDIAETLFISERTVETHRKNILHKTNTQTVVGLLKYAYERKII
ncbi:response regulator [Mucilaginibacter gotjawali]|uniref:DNA-binding NarL/FixJ family response regulator n=2 Tax=Mucilaginibacter gotjawali TaxID=1550579 RepID=A0A839SP18_9SPHI|nr:response regulator transcription factor [Mucilaginibacter gotjawali]MBB3058590.1 DNA-binding NarL/FixJ family response regulator [Mucilaginibacter gotjawali]BAU52443.1 Transcriptional regulatory protein DegU [Mucilaginibacter gotjawali]